MKNLMIKLFGGQDMSAVIFVGIMAVVLILIVFVGGPLSNLP